MGKFGRHSDFLVENDGISLFVVPYNEIKGLAVGSRKALTTTEEDSSAILETTQRDDFVQKWRMNLDQVCNDFGSAISEFWCKIFAKIADQDGSKGSLPGVAISLYVEAVGLEQAQEVLAQLKQIHKAAYHNTEALRKLVKKFDKKRNPYVEALSPVLLPVLYTANFTIGQLTLEEGISLLRELLEQTNTRGGMNESHSLYEDDVAYDSDQSLNKQIVDDRQAELTWLVRLTSSMPDGELGHLVAHRGFHSVRDYIHRRPNENSLTAYETAWTHGVHLCECDIALTKDEKLILSHDEDFSRLALNKNAPASTKKIHELTFKELMSMPLTSASRPPLLIDVLRSACAIGDSAQIVIEIKPGNEPAVMALTRMLMAYPEFIPCIACIISFDAYTMHQLRHELWSIVAPSPPPSEQNHRRHRSRGLSFSSGLVPASPAILPTGRKYSITSAGDALGEPSLFLNHNSPADITPAIPKLMMLTVEGPPKTPCKLRVGIHDLSPLESAMVSSDGALDGVYLEYQPAMLEPEGLAILRQLSETYCVGVWNRGGEPDNYETFHRLVNEGNVTFVNTDLPDTFRTDVPVQRVHRIRRMTTL